MSFCPFCGSRRKNASSDTSAFGQCSKCRAFYESSPFHLFLSACWCVRKTGAARFEDVLMFGFDEMIARFAFSVAGEAGMCHDEAYHRGKKLLIHDKII